MYYSAIGLLAVAILIIENMDILMRAGDAFEGPAWKVYRRFLVAVLVYYVTDIVWGILESRKFEHLLFADTSVYFVAMAAGIVLWTRYIVTYLDEKSVFERLLLYAGRLIASAVSALAVVNLFYPVIFTVDADCVYHPLPLRDAILVSQVMLLVFISLYALTSYVRRDKTARVRKRYRTLGMFGFIMAACLIVQLQFPLLPLYAIAYMLGTCLLRAFVIGDEKEEYRLGLEEATRIAGLKQSITSLLNNMPALTFSKDVETGVYLACNQSFAEYAHRQSPEGVEGLTDYEIFDKETAAHFVEDDRKALAMDRPHVFYEDVLDAAGNARQFQTTKLKFYDSNERMCLLGMSIDVTEAEQAKEAYRKAVSEGTIYENIVGALSGDYFNLFYIDLQTDNYIEYGSRTKVGDWATEAHGTDFFGATLRNAQTLIYSEDRAQFLEAMEKDRLLGEIRKNGTFIIQYRLLIDDVPTYVNLKATFAAGDCAHLIIGVNNIDAQMRDRAEALRAGQERKSYLSLSALNGNLMVLYFVDPNTMHYTEFSSSKGYTELGIAKQGDDFFKDTYVNSLRTIHPDDRELFHSLVTKNNVLRTIEQDGVFALDYRLQSGGVSTYVRLKAAMTEEDGQNMLIIGLLDEDAQIRREQEYVHDLDVAKRMASVDALTGVKNKYAYAQWEARVDAKIQSGTQEPFAVVVCDINNMKAVNDLYGHKEGDACIKRSCRRICEVFDHSPVFRVGGDEFVVLLTGSDYSRRDELVATVNELPEDLSSVGAGDTLSAGMVEFKPGRHNSVSSVFEEADKAMYQRKERVKNLLP